MFENSRCPGKRAHSSGSECATGRPLSVRFRRRVVRNDGEDHRLAGSRSLGPTPADALSVVPASPSPATGEDESRDSRKNTPSGFGADWSHCKRSRDPGIPAESSRSTARYKHATMFMSLTWRPNSSPKMLSRSRSIYRGICSNGNASRSL